MRRAGHRFYVVCGSYVEKFGDFEMKTIKVQNRGWDEVKIPSVPNFILRPEDEFPIPIHELSDAQLEKVADAWKKELITKARRKRNFKW